MDYEKFCNEVLKFDRHIRYVAIGSKDEYYGKMRENVTNLLTPVESEKSLKDALLRWKTRVSLAHKLGSPTYAMTEYKKIKRITFPLSGDRLALISMDPAGYDEIIIKELIETIDKFY